LIGQSVTSFEKLNNMDKKNRVLDHWELAFLVVGETALGVSYYFFQA